MPTRPTFQPIPLTPAQTARLRTLDLRLLATFAFVYAALAALTLTDAPLWPVIPIALAAYAPTIVAWLRFRRSFPRGHAAPLIPEYPRNILHSAAFVSCTGGMGMLALILIKGPSSFSLIFPFVLAAMALLHAANCSFRFSPPSCADCRYPLEGLAFPLSCPECGRRIALKSQAVTCRKLRKPHFRAAAVACLLLPIAASWFAFHNPGVITTRLPPAARLALAPTDGPAFTSVLPTLTPDERNRLINAILDARGTDAAWDMDAQLAWLAQEHAADRLTPAQSERFANEPVRFEIAADAIRKVGLPMRITLTGDAPPPVPTPVRFYFFARGFEIDGILHPTESNGPFYTFMLIADGDPDPRSTPLIAYTPTRPGPVTARIDLIAITTTSPTPTITWHDDGTYTITPAPLTIHEHTAEATLTIEP